MIYGKELEKYIREMERLSKEARAKSQDPKTRAPRKYAMLADDYKLRAEIAREVFIVSDSNALLRVRLYTLGKEADKALKKLDTDPERKSTVREVLENLIYTAERCAGYYGTEGGDTDGKT